MKIVKLTAENVKRLRAVEITPDGHVQVIAGRNAQGKSSILDSIFYALGGGPAAKGTTKPIRDGETEAHVTLDLGDLIVTRTWKGEKSTLRVESVDGAQYKSPQAMLDSLVGRLSFDPLAFAQQDERTQLKSLLELVELPFDPADLDAERADLYERRTTVGRIGKQLEGQLAGMSKPAEDLPTDEVSVQALLAEHRAAREAHALHGNNVREVDRLNGGIAETLRRIEQLEAELAQARATEAEQRGSLYDAELKAEQSASLPDLASIEKRLAEADDINRAIRAANERAEVAAKIDGERARYLELSELITALDKRKADAITAAKMPIDGLAFDESGVTYRSVPFKQCSAAEQLRVSMAMAMAMNPKLRVLRISDGSLLDSENMRLIEQMAIDQDYQVWIEVVDETGKVGVVIEDGSVVQRVAS